MRVIHVAGYSGSGKTTLITQLIPLLREKGPVAVIKHMHHHVLSLPEGKDTTRFTHAGADSVCAIDTSFLHITESNLDLGALLARLCGSGIETCIIEGYKSLPLPKVAIGSIEAARIILRDPEPADVISCESRFPVFLTPGKLVEDLLGTNQASMQEMITLVHMPLPWLAGYGDTEYDAAASRWENEKEEMAGLIAPGIPGNVRIAMHLHQGRFFGGDDMVYIAVLSTSPGDMISAIEHIHRGQQEIQAVLHHQRLETGRP